MASTPVVSSNSKKGKSKAPTVVSKPSRPVLQFPIDRVSRALKVGKYSERVAAGAPVYLASVLQYMAAEVLKLSGNEAKIDGKSRIGPRHIELAIRNNKELSTLLVMSQFRVQGGRSTFMKIWCQNAQEERTGTSVLDLIEISCLG